MQIYQVGGAVRDKLLGLPISDRDFVVVGATYAQMQKLGFKAVGKHFPVFLHPQTGEEYALARTERKSGKGYGGFTFYADSDVSLQQDLSRRDLTINAIAMDKNGVLIDPYNGLVDLSNKILRHVSPAFVEDPLRVLRVARFAARFAHLGFIVADETMLLMQQIVQSGELAFLSSERIWQEFAKALTMPSPQIFIAVLHQCGALAFLMPDLDFARSFANLSKAANTQQDALIRFACLLFNLAQSAIKKIGSTYKIPNDYIDLSLLSSKLYLFAQNLPNLKIDQIPAQMLTFLLQADFYRRPQRLNNAILVLDICAFELKEITAFILDCAEKTALISPQNLVKNGLKGAQISAELNNLRTQTISQIAVNF